MRRSARAHLASLAYTWEVTGAGVMKAYLRPVDRTPCVGVGGQSRVPGSWLKLNTKWIITGRANCWLLHLSTLPFSSDSSSSSSSFLLLPCPYTPPFYAKDHEDSRKTLAIFVASRDVVRNYSPPNMLRSER